MRRLITLGASVFLLAMGGSAIPAMASTDQAASNAGGSQAFNGSSTTQNGAQGQSHAGSQQVSQDSGTVQEADSTAVAYQNAVNANVQVNVGGYDVYVGPSSATQKLSNSADSTAKNEASTKQHATQEGGGLQSVDQDADTRQHADSEAFADQNAVNANVTVTIGGGDVHSGASNASQYASNSARSDARNEAETTQSAAQAGLGEQAVEQHADTHQDADSKATAKQNVVNANVPVNIAGGDVYAGPSSASQFADNSARSDAENAADTEQDASQAGGAQSIVQDADTRQHADSKAFADQNAVNANVPVNIAGGKVHAGPTSADQHAVNTAESEAENEAGTEQSAAQTGGLLQSISQEADTHQDADSKATAKQNAVNADAPVNVAGEHVSGGHGKAHQELDNSAESEAENEAETEQFAAQEGGGAQSIDQRAETKQFADSDAKADQDAVNEGSGGHADQDASNAADSEAENEAETEQEARQAGGLAQEIHQDAETVQFADSDADADQHAENSSAAGGADQRLDNEAESEAENEAKTEQKAAQFQAIADDCTFLCGGHAQGQWINQDAKTVQEASSDADADQNAVNSGGVIGDANQHASNSAESEAENEAHTDQHAAQSQKIASKCEFLCGGHAQGQWVDQQSTTVQVADSDANADQNAVNGGGVIGDASQFVSNSADSSAENTASTHQDAAQSQVITGGCQFLCGGHAQGQWIDQSAATVQDADSKADADQNAVNSGGLIGNAHQGAANSAESSAGNRADTVQDAAQSQLIADGCQFLCGGHAQGQWIDQWALTAQDADSKALADQNATNSGGPAGDAKQAAANAGDSWAANLADTVQNGAQAQKVASTCPFLCGGDAQGQELAQDAKTLQHADSFAAALQDLVNGGTEALVAEALSGLRRD